MTVEVKIRCDLYPNANSMGYPELRNEQCRNTAIFLAETYDGQIPEEKRCYQYMFICLSCYRLWTLNEIYPTLKWRNAVELTEENLSKFEWWNKNKEKYLLKEEKETISKRCIECGKIYDETEFTRTLGNYCSRSCKKDNIDYKIRVGKRI